MRRIPAGLLLVPEGRLPILVLLSVTASAVSEEVRRCNALVVKYRQGRRDRIRIHVTFLLFLAWIWAVTYMSGGANAAWSGLLFMVLLLCVLVHEYGHILAARAFGVSTRDVTLLPIGGVAQA